MNIGNALAKAQRLMLDENWNRQVEIGAAAHKGKSINGGGGNDLAALEAQAFGHSMSAQQPSYSPVTEHTLMEAQRRSRPGINDGTPIQMLQEQYQTPNPQNSRLPQSVLKSFAEMPPLSGDDGYSEVPQSYFESLSLQQPRQQYAPQPQYQQPMQYGNVGGVDYGLIKRLVAEALQESRGLLTEGAAGPNIRGMRITDGSVIQFIDMKGNLYEGTLKLKKKAQK